MFFEQLLGFKLFESYKNFGYQVYRWGKLIFKKRYCSPPKVKKVINIVLLIKKDIQDKSVYKFAEL